MDVPIKKKRFNTSRIAIVGGAILFLILVIFILISSTGNSKLRVNTERITISEIREGDVLRFHNAGAYCFSMASNYNSRFRPAEVLVHDSKDYLIRSEETFEDLLRNQVAIDFNA